MLYTSYRQQYVFGHEPIELKNLDDGDATASPKVAPAASYLGSNTGLQAALDDGTHGDVSGYTLPINLKANGRAAYNKIRVDIKVLEAPAGSGAAATIDFVHCDDASGKPDTSNAAVLMSIPISTAMGLVASTEPWMSFTMPSNLLKNVAVKMLLSGDGSNAFSAGKLLIQMNPNL